MAAGRRAPEPDQCIAAMLRQRLREGRKLDALLALGKRRHEVRLPPREQDHVTHVEAREHEAGEERSGIELHHRYPCYGAIHDQQHRGRDQDAEAASRGHRARRDFDVVSGLEHRRKSEQAHQRHHCADNPGRRGEDRARDDGCDRERPRHSGSGEVQTLEQLVDQLRPLDEIAHEEKQRDRDQHVVRHDAVGALHEKIEHALDRGRRIDAAVRKPSVEHAHPHERKCRGKSEHDAHADQREHHEAQVAVAEVGPGREHDHGDDDQRHQREAEPELLAQPQPHLGCSFPTTY